MAENTSKQIFILEIMCMSIASGLFIAEKMSSFKHSYATLTVRSAIECCLHCEHEALCNSANFCPINKTCELNDRSPADFPYSDAIATPNKDLYFVSTDPCPDPWILYNRHCYRVVSSKQTWEQSKENCNMMEAYLTDILDDFENTFVTQLCSGAGLRMAWLGIGNYHTIKPQFWTSGQQVNYTNFAPDQPNNNKGNQECIDSFIHAGGTWNDAKCNALVKSVCKKRHY